jgi:molybdopterin converting factor subunit 1
MQVRFRLFASLSERTGTAEGNMELPGDATVRDLWEALCSRFPALAETGFVPMAACDMEYADWDLALEGVDEVAFLPPVSGG